MSAGLGVAALVLCQQVIAPISFATQRQLDELPLILPLTMVGAAVVLVVLFGLGRLVQHIRKDLQAEAVGAEG
jgi:hypothetical protein